jgi:hypothetical protein
MALARTFARYLAPMQPNASHAGAGNRRTRHLILRGIRSRAALAPAAMQMAILRKLRYPTVRDAILRTQPWRRASARFFRMYLMNTNEKGNFQGDQLSR